VHARWLSSLIFEHLTQQVADVVSTWSMAPVVEAGHPLWRKLAMCAASRHPGS
jgi:hypothetical protein